MGHVLRSERLVGGLGVGIMMDVITRMVSEEIGVRLVIPGVRLQG